MTATSRHLPLVGDHIAAGAHVVLTGHVGDEVLIDGKVVDEIGAIGQMLGDRAGIERVVVVDQTSGLHCLNRDHQERISALLRSSNTEGARLGATDQLQVAFSVHALLTQDQTRVAVIIRDVDLLFESDTGQGRRAQSVLIEAMNRAAIAEPEGIASPRNALLLLSPNQGHASTRLASIPGVVTQPVDPPNLAERTSALKFLETGFFGAEQLTNADQNVEALARVSYGFSLRNLAQLRLRSHSLKIPLSRPETLFRASTGSTARTAIDLAGVDKIMSFLEEDIIGQPAALDRIRASLERGRWTTANRTPGSRSTRPMAKLLLFGPPGVGKTETARSLAESVSGSRSALVKIDCAEYQNEHDIARLTGSPNGYVDSERGGLLHSVLRSGNPVVVLIDEFDRANARLWELFIGILDDGRLTDGRGDTITFENTIVILTTNIGSGLPVPGSVAPELMARYEALNERPLMASEEYLELSETIVRESLANGWKPGATGSPALLSRLDSGIVGFDVLRHQAVDRIVAKSCTNLAANLEDELEVKVSFDARGFSVALAERLGPEGSWDGRTVGSLFESAVEGPVRSHLDNNQDLAEAHFHPSPDGRAECSA